MHWRSVEQTHRGNRRRSNEDAVLSRPELGLWAVADGMGGHQAGDVASRAIADALAGVAAGATLAETVDAVEDALVQVNVELRLLARNRCQGGTVGSTVVALVSRDRVGVALWAGDSRLYRLRRRQLELITRDHNPVADLLDTGVVSEADALAADTNIITRAVGGQPELHLDIAVFDVEAGDTYLLCSDGLYREVALEGCVETLGQPALEAVADELLQRCLASAARDNVSLVLARPEAP